MPPSARSASRNALSARPGFVSRRFTAFAASATVSAPRTDRVAASPTTGIATSFRTPVVRPAPRWPRQPRSGPLQMSSTRPTAATPATVSLTRLGAPIPPSTTAAPTRGRRCPRRFTASGPAATRASRSWRPRWTNPAASRPVARWARSSSISSSVSPARRASIVIRISHPKPGARGKTAPRARSLTNRWPESGSRTRRPVRSRTSALATPFAIPNPPPIRRAKAATTRSARPSTRRVTSPTRSASQRRSGPGAAARSPAESASPFPRRPRRMTTAPASSALSAVPSSEAPSTTRISAAGKLARSAATVVAIRSASFRAATRIVGSAPGGRELGGTGRREGRDRPVGLVAEPIVARLGALEEEREREPAGRKVDVVHAREPRTPVRLERRLHAGAFRSRDADGWDAGALEAADNAVEERLGRLALGARRVAVGLPRSRDDDAVDVRRHAARLLLDERTRDLVHDRVVRRTAAELRSESAAEVPEVVACVVRESLVGVEVVVEPLGIDGHVEGDEARRTARSGILERARDFALEVVVHGAEEDDGERLAAQAILYERHVGTLDERLERREPRAVGLPRIALGGKLRPQSIPLARGEGALGAAHLSRDRDAEDDSDREGEEDGRERRDVVAEVEQAPGRLPRKALAAFGEQPPPGRLDADCRLRPALGRGHELDACFEPLRDVEPQECAAGLDAPELDGALAARASEEPRRAAAPYAPASADREAAAV